MQHLAVDDYANSVLGVIKEKFGLNGKAQALVKFARAYGGEFVEEQASDEYVKKMMERCNAHVKKHDFKKMIDRELNELFEANREPPNRFFLPAGCKTVSAFS